MKRVRLFATVSIFCLGIAAVATTEAHSSVHVDGYEDDGSGHCLIKVARACTDQTGTDCVDGNGNPLYQFNQLGLCTNQLRKYPD